MSKLEGTIICDNCGVEITWAPVVIGSRHYCCQDCFHDLPCDCQPAADWEDDRRQEKELVD